MPHLIVDYSPGLFAPDSVAQTLLELNAAVIGSGSIQKESDLKSRMIPLEATRVGTEAGARGFVYAQLRVLPGRTPAMRAELSQRIAGVIRARCARPVGMSVQLSVEVIEMERESYVKEVL
ncbi:5-carboxymethyl-2-hydroxymuconate Delta-isomerase [Herbaspirillum rhizosphaerae]|uniref:5-carboxymethyl-2-hydroxymuconate Delta-isomerase n=1 Tax=Herbaspirillum rhizosphaerae TaxID=346179 RepID=UPI00067BDB89|nr:5-carboxymethyl-2-hydroxymuconate Delta-isomerase [Herbaspirillum rhizosphaerae]